MRKTTLFAVVCSLSLLASAHAADVWVVHGDVMTPRQPGVFTRWDAFAILHNVSDASATVRLVGANPVSITIAAGTSRTSHFGERLQDALWVSRFDVPSGVRVEGRLELWLVEPFTGRPPTSVPFAKLSMPVFDRLAPPGEEQFHFGTDIGGKRSRVNVAIYNGGAVPATARITVLEPLCATTIAEQTALIAPNQIVQVPVENPPRISCANGWARSIRVIVDQPSFSFVSVLATEGPPDVTTAVVE